MQTVMRASPSPLGGGRGQPSPATYFEKHVFLTGRQVHPVLVVIHAQVHDVGQQLFIARNHFELLLQGLEQSRRPRH